ncbi:hypothetical protein ACFLV0_02470 [Chloroflexota bacterium]
MIRDYILLAAGCFFVGVVLALIAYSVRSGIDIFDNMWILAIPAALAVILNVILLEIYRKFRKKKP